MSRNRGAITVTLLYVLLCVAGPLQAAEIVPPGKATGPCMGEKGFGDAWLDRTHSYINTLVCQPSVWFDNFFGEQRSEEDWAGSLVRVSSYYRFDEDGEEEGAGTEVSASLRLPRMSRKLKLVITSDRQEDHITTYPDEDPYDQDGELAGAEERGRSTAGLRLYMTDTKRVRLNLGIGARLKDRLEPYFRIRLRVTELITRRSLIRLTPALVWFGDEGINQSFRIDLERRLGEDLMIRATESALWKEAEPGVGWGVALSLFDRITPNLVAVVEGSAKGNTYPKNDVQRYRFLTRFRSNFLRPWLFFEAAPELYWPRDEFGNYRKKKATTVKVEVQFFS